MPKVNAQTEADPESAEIAREKKRGKAEEAKRAKEKKALEAANKKKAFADYEERLKEVEELKAMTDTPAWQKYYAEMMASIEKHAVDILETEKPRETIRHQEGVKILRGQIFKLKQPIDTLNNFVNNTPLFAPADVARANFNEALGTVELTR